MKTSTAEGRRAPFGRRPESTSARGALPNRAFARAWERACWSFSPRRPHGTRSQKSPCTLTSLLHLARSDHARAGGPDDFSGHKQWRQNARRHVDAPPKALLRVDARAIDLEWRVLLLCKSGTDA